MLKLVEIPGFPLSSQRPWIMGSSIFLIKVITIEGI
jgi:hypothetical protein